MRPLTLAVMVAGMLAQWSAIAAAQSPVTPAPTLTSPAACPAVVRMAWDVTAVSGADHVRWRILKGAPGTSVGAAELADNGRASGATGSLTRDLRDIGPVLDGTRYFFRLRAFRGDEPLAELSSPALFELDRTPDGMFVVKVVQAPSGSAASLLKLEWSLTGPIGACADRIAWEVKKDAPFADGQAPDPAALSKGALSGTSGSHSIGVPGPGTYYARGVARHGGDTETDEVGRWGPALVQSIAPSVALRIEVEDVAFSACVGGSVTVPGATVRVTGSGFDETRTADPAGRASFTVPAGGIYQVTASAATCLGRQSVQVTPTADTDLKVRLPDCYHPRADLRLTTSDPWPGGVSGSPYSMTFTIRHGGLGGPSRPADLRVERVASGTSAVATEVRRSTLGALCPSQARTVTVVDPNPQFGTWVYRVALVVPTTTTLLADANEADNLLSRTASFLAPAPVSADFSYLTITSFRLQNGAAWAGVGAPLSLQVTSTGQTPREYRAGECGSAFDAAAFRPYVSSPAPTLAGFTTTGTRIVCLQMRGSSVTSATVRDTIAIVVPPELDVSVTQSSNPVVAGQDQTYTVVVGNTGGLPAGGIVVRSTISEYVEFRAANVGPPFNTGCSRSGTTVTCTIPALGPGQRSTLTVRTRVPATAASGHDISFSARVDPDDAIAESNERNNLASAIASTVFSTAGIAPAAWQRTTSEHYRLECPLGEVLSGVYGDSGDWLDNIGIICAGSRRGLAYTGVYGGLIPEPFEEGCPLGYIPRLILWAPPFNNTFIERPGLLCPPSKISYRYDPAKAVGVRGTVTFKAYGEIARMEAACPDGAFPVGIDAYVDRAALSAQKGIAGVGMVCARVP